MDVLETLASVLNYILEFIAQAMYILLRANYNFMTVLIRCATVVLNNITSVLDAALHLSHSYINDFCTFIKEFFAVICLVMSYIAHVLHSLYIMFLSLFQSLFDVGQFVLSAVHIAYSSLCYVTNYVAVALTYASKLIFQAVILLLMFFPNVFMCLYNMLLRGAICVFHYILMFLSHFKYVIIDTAHVVKVESANVFYSVPLKAYIGLLILLVLYYKRKPVVQHSVKGFVLLTFFLRYAVRTVCFLFYASFSYMLSLITKPFLWVLQLLRRYLSSLTRNENPQQNWFSVIWGKFSFTGVFRKTLGSVFHHSKSTSVNLSDPDQVAHLRYLEQKLNEERDRHLCIVCQDAVRAVLLLPCRHLCLCNECWQSLRDRSTGCPVCRRSVYDAFDVYV